MAQSGYIPGLFVQSNRPGIPVTSEGLVDSLLGLQRRKQEMQPALDGLTTSYTLGGQTLQAKDFLYGAEDRFASGLAQLIQMLTQVSIPPEMLMLIGNILDFNPETSPLTRLPLESADQWSISITNFGGEHASASADFPRWEETLTDVQKATERFWPTIAENGLAYNLLLLKKATPAQVGFLRARVGTWKPAWDLLVAAGHLYYIDLTIFDRFPMASVDGHLRFTPGTVTLLEQDAATKSLQPIAVRVAGQNGAGRQVYEPGDAAWLYGLQAAKTSVTAYGIWLGHVYHWHIVTAAAFMGFRNKVARTHPLSLLLRPQSNFLIQFDEILLALWKFIAPPTSFDTPEAFLKLIDAFAENRSFHDDDPLVELANNGIQEADFTRNHAWDAYPIVGIYTEMWAATKTYVDTVVDFSYQTDAQVAQDVELRAWMNEAKSPFFGNLRGLPEPLSTVDELKNLLTSLIYRVTMHGCSRLHKSLSPVLSYVANYPVCLQRSTIPPPQQALTTQELLSFMPKTGTIGLMVQFYGIFIYSSPYQSLIPVAGANTDLYFSTNPTDARNQALLAFRNSVAGLMQKIQPQRQQLQQWPRSIET